MPIDQPALAGFGRAFRLRGLRPLLPWEPELLDCSTNSLCSTFCGIQVVLAAAHEKMPRPLCVSSLGRLAPRHILIQSSGRLLPFGSLLRLLKGFSLRSAPPGQQLTRRSNGQGGALRCACCALELPRASELPWPPPQGQQVGAKTDLLTFTRFSLSRSLLLEVAWRVGLLSAQLLVENWQRGAHTSKFKSSFLTC